MPELPEVETLRRGLECSVIQRVITEVSVTDFRILKDQPQTTFEERVVGRRIVQIDRRGKYLLIALESSQAPAQAVSLPRLLCIHLKMRGQLRLQSAQATADPYLCLSLILDNGMALRFYDMWVWGEIRALTPAELAQMPGLSELGPEPLTAEWSADLLAGRLANRKGALKTTLLNQRVIAGVGNIYADESLFQAGLHPQRPANSLSSAEVDRLAASLRSVLEQAVGGGGTQSEEFTDLGGKAGTFVPSVYDRAGDPCPSCQTPLTKIKLGGRGTVFCTRCQPDPAYHRGNGRL